MIPFPDKKYSIIYADPPWSYEVWSKKGQGRSAESHYSTMPQKDIMTLPVCDIANKDCSLFMWITMPCLSIAPLVLAAWGFKYKTCAFVWVKTNKRAVNSLFTGMGYWTRANAELCLLATKGSPKRQSKSVHQMIVSPVGKHSQKPGEVRDRIVTLMGDLPRIELFARQQAPGWDAWGDEVDA
jgi:N6-adenosine-specific RNA methylase IME4